MKVLLNALFYLSGLLLLLSCKPDAHYSEKLVELDFHSIQETEEPYTISHFIPLEVIEDNFLTDYLTVKIHEEAVYVWDEKVQDAIHQFDLKGNYVGKVIKIGEGPGMVKNISDFFPTGDSFEVLESLGDVSKILVFDRDYVLKKEIQLGYLASSFGKLGQHTYAASGSYNLPFVQHRLVLMDREGKRMAEFLPNEYKNQMLPMTEKNFNRHKDRVFFHEIFNPVAYEVERDSLLPRFQFDFGNYGIPKKFWEVDIMQGFEMINQNGFATLNSYWENEVLAFMEVLVQAQGEITHHHVIWDHNTGEALKRVVSDKRSPIFKQPVLLLDDQIIFIAQASDIGELDRDLLPDGSVWIDSNENPVLVFANP